SQDFPLDPGLQFPKTFTVTPDGRDGDLSLSATALDAAGQPVGLGSATLAIEPGGRTDVDLQLDPADYLVNAAVVGDQKLGFRADYSGRQIGVAPDGAFVIVWEDTCTRCDILARLF